MHLVQNSSKTYVKGLWCVYNNRLDDFSLRKWLNIWHHQYSMCIFFLGKMCRGMGWSLCAQSNQKEDGHQCAYYWCGTYELKTKVLCWCGCVCVCVSVPNTLLFATYLTLIRSEITYVFILYEPMPISIGENVMHVILSSLA